MADQADIIDSEIWKDVVGWEGLYQVSSHGRVRSLDRFIDTKQGPKRIKGQIISCAAHQKSGYIFVRFRRPGYREMRTAHSVVCEAFHGPKPTGHQVAHGNGVRSDNRASNVRWATAKQNAEDRKRHGTENHRDKPHRGYKHDSKKVAAAKEMVVSGVPKKQVAEALGMSLGALVYALAPGLRKKRRAEMGWK